MCDFFVSIDTSVIKSNNYDFDNEVFKSLIELSQNEYIHLLLSDVVVRETKVHILKDIQESEIKATKAIQNIKSYCKDIEINDTELAKKINNFALRAKELAEQKISNFLSETRCEIVPSSNVQTEEVLSLYFAKRPPFSEQKAKQNEFKDAYILLSLRDYMKGKNKDLYVVSTDGDWTKFAQENKGIIAPKDLKTLLDMINRIIHEKEEILNKLKNNFNKNSAEFQVIKDDINEFLLENEDKISIFFSADSMWGYQNVDDIEYHLEDFNFKEINSDVEFNILKIENNEVIISCPINLEFHIEGITPLYFYDREDGVDITMANATIDETIHIKSSIVVRLKDVKEGLSIEDISLSDRNFNVDLGYLDPDPDFYE